MANGRLPSSLPQACNDIPAESDGFVLDANIAHGTRLQLSEVRDCVGEFGPSGICRRICPKARRPKGANYRPR